MFHLVASEVRRSFRRFRGIVSVCIPALLFWASTAPVGAQQDTVPLRPIGNIFDPLSVPARAISDIGIFASLICLGIFIVVAGLLVFTVIKFRRKVGDDDAEPPQIYGSTQIELAWTVLPVLITVVLVLVTARTIAEIQNRKIPESAVTIRIIGHQWWWEARYPQYGFVTANEIHIPLSTKDRPVITELQLESADVIHSFWVPQLNGKTDVIPNRTNRMWLEPEQTGVYLGNCAEYCGTQHANMLLRVVVHDPAEFEKWVQSQQAPAMQVASAQKGRELFASLNCVNCHRIDGSIAEGVFGPDLTHLMTRRTIGAGVAANTPENLHQWVRDPQVLKVGCLMPNLQLLDNEVDEIVGYLQTLH